MKLDLVESHTGTQFAYFSTFKQTTFVYKDTLGQINIASQRFSLTFSVSVHVGY